MYSSFMHDFSWKQLPAEAGMRVMTGKQMVSKCCKFKDAKKLSRAELKCREQSQGMLIRAGLKV